MGSVVPKCVESSWCCRVPEVSVVVVVERKKQKSRSLLEVGEVVGIKQEKRKELTKRAPVL